jgi:hypothetical protein
MVAELRHLSIVEAIPAKGRRAKGIRLSQRGWRCVQLGRSARTHIDNRFIRAVGRSSYEKAESTLLTCLRALGGVERSPSGLTRLHDLPNSGSTGTKRL